MAPLPRIRVSQNRRFLVTEDGQPFFWLGDTAWELFHRLTRAETELYLQNRRLKGFNLVQAVALAEFDGLRTPNANGDLPLIDLDPARPNEAYFAHLDWVVRRAAELGLYIGLLPTWGDKLTPMWGQGPAIFNEKNARAYGRWIGERYREASNLVWILGGDRPERDKEGNDLRPIVRAMAAGIRAAAGSQAFMTYHPAGRAGSAAPFHNDEWLDLNMWQSGHRARDVANWEMITADYLRVPVKPVLDGEPNYEDHPVAPWPVWDPASGYFRDHDVRKAAYRAVFAGACGHTYGHHSIWQFYDPALREPINHPWCSWQEALERPGAAHLGQLRRLMQSRPFLTRLPDQGVLRSPAGVGAEHARATREDGGAYLMVYLPLARSVEVDLGKLSGQQARAWWFDPRSGAAAEIGTFETGGWQTFTPPGEGPDWVLVVDDAARGFGAPGAA